MVKQSEGAAKGGAKAACKSKRNSGPFTAPSQPATSKPIRRGTCAHGKVSLVGSAKKPARRETGAHGSDVLADTGAEEVYLFSAEKITRPKSQNNNCCGFMTLVNTLDTAEQRLIFCEGNLKVPEAAFMAFVKERWPKHNGKKYGYTHRHMQDYMKRLISFGKIKEFTFRKLKKFEVTDMLGPRGLNKRLRPDDNLVVFGRASKSDTGLDVQGRANKAEKLALEQGASKEEAAAVALDTYCRHSSKLCNTSNPTHAVGVRYRSKEVEGKVKTGAELVDPAKQKAKELSVSNYATSMAEHVKVTEAGKEELAALYYVFRVGF